MHQQHLGASFANVAAVALAQPGCGGSACFGTLGIAAITP